jgi:transposase
MSSEIISTVERRRSWSAEQKLRIMSEALEPGATVTAVAGRNGVCRSQLYAWLQQARDGRLPGIFLSPPTAAAFRSCWHRSSFDFGTRRGALSGITTLTRLLSCSSFLSRERGRDLTQEWSWSKGRRVHRSECARASACCGRWGPLVITVPAGVKIYLACGVTDMRRGFDGLSIMAQDVLKQNPFSGAIFCFRGRRGSLVKILYWDGQGFCLFAKRLEKGRFTWPSTKEGAVTLTLAQMSMLLEGLEWRNPQQTWAPTLAG